MDCRGLSTAGSRLSNACPLRASTLARSGLCSYAREWAAWLPEEPVALRLQARALAARSQLVHQSRTDTTCARLPTGRVRSSGHTYHERRKQRLLSCMIALAASPQKASQNKVAKRLACQTSVPDGRKKGWCAAMREKRVGGVRRLMAVPFSLYPVSSCADCKAQVERRGWQCGSRWHRRRRGGNQGLAPRAAAPAGAARARGADGA